MDIKTQRSGVNFAYVLKKNAMLVILVLVYLFFMVTTAGNIFKPAQFKALIDQNAYVYILGAGMLMCMLTEDPLGTFADIWERSFGGE